jgi:hypothetical protein
MMSAPRDFGSIRRLPSGRWQDRYRNDADQLVSAARTFETKAEASNYLASMETDQARGLWVDRVQARCRSRSTPRPDGAAAAETADR